MKNLHLIILGSVATVVCGCSTQTGESHAGVYTSGADMMDAKEIALPANYDVENLDRKLQMLVAVAANKAESQGGKEGLDIDPALSTRLQTEMAKLKRFTIHATHNNAAGNLAADLADVGDVSVKEATGQKDIDLTLSVSMTATRERQRIDDGNIWIYEVECDCSCRDEKTHTVKFAEKVLGKARRHQMISMRNRRAAGFDEKTQQGAITEAAMKALADLAKKLGNTFPVGGKVTGMTPSGETMMFDRGFEQGIFKNQQTVVFVDYMGVDIPVACGTAEPGKDKSRLAVRRWNEDNKDAAAVIKELRNSPPAFFKNYKVYAVGYGIPIPPEWETFDRR